MKSVRCGTITTLDGAIRKIRDLCDASQTETEAIADAYAVTVPAGFVPVRTLDLTAGTVDAGAVLATLLLDMQQRGAGRRTSSV